MRSNGRFSRRALDHAGDTAGVTLLAEEAEDASKVAGLEAVDDVGGAQARLRHAHVERPIGAKRKAALGLVELHGGDADVEHDAVGALDMLVQRRERRLNEPEPAARLPFESAARRRWHRDRGRWPRREAPVARMAFV